MLQSLLGPCPIGSLHVYIEINKLKSFQNTVARATYFRGDKISRIAKNLEIFMDKFPRINSHLKYFQSTAKKFSRVNFQGWINIHEI